MIHHLGGKFIIKKILIVVVSLLFFIELNLGVKAAGVAEIMDMDYNQLMEIEINSPYIMTIYNLTEEEKELIYKITYAESGNQTIEGQRAVIEVILNRIHSEHYPNTVEEVLSQQGQFSTWKKIEYIEYNEEQIKALELVYREEPILNDSNYMYFNSTPFKSTQDNIQIGDHWFGKQKKKK